MLLFCLLACTFSDLLIWVSGKYIYIEDIFCNFDFLLVL